MKTAKDYLEEANAVVPKISIEEGIAKHKAGTLSSSTYVTAPKSQRRGQSQVRNW